MEEAIPKGLGFSVLGGLVLSVLGEGKCAGLDFVPAEGHWSYLWGEGRCASDSRGDCVVMAKYAEKKTLFARTR